MELVDAINVAGLTAAAGRPDHPKVKAYIKWRGLDMGELADLFEEASALIKAWKP